MVNRYADPNDPSKKRGESHHNAKLTEEDVKAIRKAYDDGVPAKIMARVFSVSQATIHSIGHRFAWKHVV